MCQAVRPSGLQDMDRRVELTRRRKCYSAALWLIKILHGAFRPWHWLTLWWSFRVDFGARQMPLSFLQCWRHHLSSIATCGLSLSDSFLHLKNSRHINHMMRRQIVRYRNSLPENINGVKEKRWKIFWILKTNKLLKQTLWFSPIAAHWCFFGQCVVGRFIPLGERKLLSGACGWSFEYSAADI